MSDPNAWGGHSAVRSLVVPDRLFGVPAHPLFVHIPVVLLPLCALIAIALAVRPSLVGNFGIPLLALTLFSTVGTFFAAESGEGLESILRKHSKAIEEHAEWGDRTRLIAIVFFLLVTAFVILTRRAANAGGATTGATSSPPSSRTPVLAGIALLVVLSGVASTMAVTKTGHTGASSAWDDAGKEG